MGYLNALSLHTYDLDAMITAQTGNLVWMGINLGSGYWVALLENLGLLFGFMFGAVFALYTYKMFRNKQLQFFYNWTVFIVPIILYPLLFQYSAPPVISFLILGFAAGATLGFFRKIYHMEINTSMATANVRFMGLYFAKGFFKRDTRGSQGRATFFIFFIAVFAFVFGAFTYIMFSRMDIVVIGLVIFCVLPYLLCPVRVKIGTCDNYAAEEDKPDTNELFVANLQKLVTMAQSSDDVTLNASPTELEKFKELLTKMVD